MLDQRLRYFLMIAETGSISEASERLGMSQSGLSRQLKELEDTLGRPLFTRTGRGVVLNEIGVRLERAARPAFETIDQTLDVLRAEFGTSHAAIRIAMVHTLSHYFLPGLLARFYESHPGINTYLLGRSSPEVVDLVREGKVDLGFVYDVAVTVENLAVHRLFEERMCLIHHKDDPVVAPHEGPHEGPEGWDAPLITFPRYYALRQMLHRAQLDRNVVAEVDTVDTMLHLVSFRLGVCILPDLMADSDLENLQLRRQRVDLANLRRWVVCISARTPASPACQALIDLAEASDPTRCVS